MKEQFAEIRDLFEQGIFQITFIDRPSSSKIITFLSGFTDISFIEKEKKPVFPGKLSC
jgi:hypothetical protein